MIRLATRTFGIQFGNDEKKTTQNANQKKTYGIEFKKTTEPPKITQEKPAEKAGFFSVMGSKLQDALNFIVPDFMKTPIKQPTNDELLADATKSVELQKAGILPQVEAKPVSSGIIRMPTAAEKKAEAWKPIQALSIPIANSLGLNKFPTPFYMPDMTENQTFSEKLKTEQLAKEYPKLTNLGSIAGNIGAYALGQSVAGKAAKALGVSSKFVNPIKSIAGNTTAGVMEGIGKDESALDIAKRVALYNALDFGATKVLPKVAGAVNKNLTVPFVSPKQMVTDTALQNIGKYKPNSMMDNIGIKAKDAKINQYYDNLKESGLFATYPKTTVKFGAVKSLADEQNVSSGMNLRLTQEMPLETNVVRWNNNGIIPPSKNTIADNFIPNNGQKPNRFTDIGAFQKSEVPTDKMKADVYANRPMYTPVSNQETLTNAFAKVDADYNTSLTDFFTTKYLRTEKDTALGDALIQRAVSKGDYEVANDVAMELAQKLTNAGKAVQAASILSRMTPEGMLRQVGKVINKANAENAGKKGFKPIKLTPEETKSIYDAMDDIRKVENGEIPLPENMTKEEFTQSKVGTVATITASKLPATMMEKFNAWRRIAMLTNPKTHIKNIGGNVIMQGLRKTSDTMGAALEKAFLKPGQRTKSIGWSKEKELVDVVNKDWETHKATLSKGGRWDLDAKVLEQEKPIFAKGRATKWVEKVSGKEMKKGILEMVNEFSKNTLNAEDAYFLKRAYKDALGQFLKANNLKAVSNEARDYATRRAFEATFKQANALSNIINNAKRSRLGTFVDIKIPFSKTPANIVYRGAEYSPIGLIKLVYGKRSPAEVIEIISKATTGTGLIAAGMYLASMGWAKTEPTRSKALENIKGLVGEQAYSIKTPMGSYTFDWAQPTSIPLAMGIAMYESMAKNKSGEDEIGLAETVWDALVKGGDTIFNTTMLKNIKDMLGGNFSTASEAVMSAPADFVEQLLPSLTGQIARTVDPYRRDTKDSNPLMEIGKNIVAKVPIASTILPKKYDVYGKPQENSNWFFQFLSPSNYKENTNDAVSQELVRLNNATKKTDFLPQFANEKITYQTGKNQPSKSIKVPPNLKDQYAQQLGQESKNAIEQLLKTTEYINQNDTNKAKMVNTAVENAKEKVNSDMLKILNVKEYKPTGRVKKLY